LKPDLFKVRKYLVLLVSIQIKMERRVIIKPYEQKLK
jgi:hypothetical protein